jgi:protocatechuate 3,4-dioxygenase beta subunit
VLWRRTLDSVRGRGWVVGAAALIVVGAVIAVWSTTHGADDPLSLPALATSSIEPALEQPGAQPDTPAPPARGPVDGAGAAQGEAPDVAEQHEPVEVLVVDARTGAPVADAEVRWAASAELPPGADPARPRWRADVAERFAGARRTTSDAAGIAVVDARLFPGMVLARRVEEWGIAFADATSARPIRIEIALDARLVLQVVDAQGRPVAGVPVGLRQSEAPSMAPCYWQGTTQGLQGLARVERIEPPRSADRPEQRIYACIDTLVPSAAAVLVDPARIPDEPVRLVLPPTGSVVVHVHDSEGTQIQPLGSNLSLASHADKEGMLAWDAPSFEPERIEPGRLHYPFVEVGLELYADAIDYARSARTTGPGPSFAGEIVEFALDLGPPVSIVTGRLVDEYGKPLPDQRVGIGIRTHPGSTASHPGKTDAEARFRIELPVAVGALLRGSIELRALGAEGGRDARARIELDAPNAPRVTDVGDLALQVPRVIASGRVVDSLGQPQPDAMLSVQVLVQEGSRERWRSEVGLEHVRGPGGTFELVGLARPDRIRIQASLQGRAISEPVVVQPGATGLELVVPRTSQLSGRLLLDAGVDPTRVVVRAVWRSDPGQTVRMPASTRANPDGTFSLLDVPTGPCRLRFSAADREEVLLELDGIEIPVDGSAQDARLDAVDVRGKM